MLLLALASTVIVLVTFVFTTLVDEPATAVLLVVILVVSVGLDLGWKRVRDGHGRRPASAVDGSIDRRRDPTARAPTRSRSGSSSTGSRCTTVSARTPVRGGRDRPRPRVRHLRDVPRADRRPPRPAPPHVRPRPAGDGQEHAAAPTTRSPRPRPGAHVLLRRRRRRTGDVGRQLARLPDHHRGGDSVPRPHRARRAGLAGRRPEQPAHREGAAADGDGRVPRADVDAADRRSRLPPVRRAQEPVAVQGDDPLPDARTRAAPGHAHTRDRWRPRPARGHRPRPRLRRTAQRRRGEGARGARPELQRPRTDRVPDRGAPRAADRATTATDMAGSVEILDIRRVPSDEPTGAPRPGGG